MLCATREVLCTRRCLLRDKLRGATCSVVLCDKLPGASCATLEVLRNKLYGATCREVLCARRDAVGSQYEVT